MVGKLRAMAAIARMGAAGARQITEIRCQRGADIARMLQLPEASAEAIMDLDEHWNGRGSPRGAKGEEASLLGRICCLAQTVEVFLSAYGLPAALDVVRERRGAWFDPRLVDVFEAIQGETDFWRRVVEADPIVELRRWEPEDSILLADEACLDRVAEAFAMVVDSKSPWTYLHSTRVAEIAVGIARQFDCPDELERDLRRAALLHDIGKLGVSNKILDKPGKPTDEELIEIRKHPDFSQQILSRVAAFHELADVAGAHHERLDGRGYHRQLDEGQLPWVTRVLTVADIYEAMSAKRPYRDAMTWEQIYDILRRDAGRGADPECLDALRRWVERRELESRVDQQLEQVERAMAAF